MVIYICLPWYIKFFSDKAGLFSSCYRNHTDKTAFLKPERVPPGGLCQRVTKEGERRVPGNTAIVSVELT